VGQGANYFYNIVEFVAVTIVPNNNGGVSVQPAAYIDPNIVFSGNAVPAGTSSSLMTTFTSPKLTQ
jgi:hypothetical protein